MHFYAWKSGLKTGMYYLRTKAAVDAIKFTLDNSKKQEVPTADVVESEVLATAITKPEGKTAVEVAAIPVQQDVDVKPMSAAEMKALIAQAKASEGDDDCLMCGS